MRLMEYLADKLVVILLNITAMLALSMYLLVTGNYYTNVILILLAWFVILVFYFSVDYYLRRKYFKEMLEILNELDQRFLIGEVHTYTPRLEDRFYHEILRKSNKAVLEEIRKLEDIQKDYKEYIEAWIHDVKTPLTAINLMCENHKDDTMRRIQAENGKIEGQVENVLYYARMENTYQDYMIHRVDLQKIVTDTVKRNKLYFIQKQMQVQVEIHDAIVSTDEKWVEFLINQIFSNAIKYARKEEATLRVNGDHDKNSFSLCIEDNGPGIPQNEIERIFDKGFTGTNGREVLGANSSTSTGIGLYLCKKLSNKLGIGIKCESVEGEYTRMFLIFPDSDYHGNLSKM